MNVRTGSLAAKFWVAGGGLALLLAVAHLFNDALSSMLMGLTVGLAGLLYVGVGRLQEVVGMAPAMALSYLALLPAALLARAAVDGRRAGPGGAKTP
ncbi:hypothetical protein Mterra_00357 [Calidithermus terrae]|uniref:Uncharacterized protein n=1 Tax=Calidithermus terrae TaxID=1408545 RepID=A0A399F6Q1_9DEIN|nr:hypothetical protein [Calidithermus terrae]RIH90562.1 hypothetical protein Mterra_00357 [Calidithermus terrae]